MEIRDVLHGSIQIYDHERAVIDSPYFQRLRSIRQLGFAEYSYPSATHNRFTHSLGALSVANEVFENIFYKKHKFSSEDFQPLQFCLRLSALLHDIGHGPLSHTTEFAMPPRTQVSIQKFSVPANATSTSLLADHEDYTLKMILDSDLTEILNLAGKNYGFNSLHVASLIHPGLIPDHLIKDFFTVNGVSFQPLLQQVVSSELDADRMDYLRRDSLYAGVSYGQFDYDWLVSNLNFYSKDQQAYLAIEHRALYSFEDFLISRFHMFLQVYFHHKSVIYDSMLSQYFNSEDCDYKLPASIPDYIRVNDSHLYAHLAKSSNPWAKRITHKNPYQMLIEVHSGIPAQKKAKEDQTALFEEIKKTLASKNIHYIETQATGELSKYFKKTELPKGLPLYVRYDNHLTQATFIPLEKCTDLFERYSEKRSISRLYVEPEQIKKAQSLTSNFRLSFD